MTVTNSCGSKFILFLGLKLLSFYGGQWRSRELKNLQFLPCYQVAPLLFSISHLNCHNHLKKCHLTLLRNWHFHWNFIFSIFPKSAGAKTMFSYGPIGAYPGLYKGQHLKITGVWDKWIPFSHREITTIQKRSINWEEERKVCIKHPFHWACFPSTSFTCLFPTRSYTSVLLHLQYLKTLERELHAPISFNNILFHQNNLKKLSKGIHFIKESFLHPAQMYTYG